MDPPLSAIMARGVYEFAQKPLEQRFEQHSLFSVQRSPPRMQRQWPSRQDFEQQSLSLLQMSPLSPHSHRPSRQTPEQQPLSRLQPALAPAHLHLPFLHFLEQQFWSFLHLALLPLQLASRATSLPCAKPSSARARVKSAAVPPASDRIAERRDDAPATMRVQLSKRQSSTHPSSCAFRHGLRVASRPAILRAA